MNPDKECEAAEFNMLELVSIPLYSVFDADRYCCHRELVAEIDFYRIWPPRINHVGSPIMFCNSKIRTISSGYRMEKI